MAAKKRIMPFILMLVILGLPFGSWYYLDSGLKVRKALEDETISKGSFFETSLGKQINQAYPELSQGFKEKTSLIVIGGDESTDQQVYPVYDQFKKVENFQIIKFTAKPQDEDIFKTYMLTSLEGSPRLLLLDTENNIANEYAIDQNSLKQLVQHIAITIPVKKDRDIIVKTPE